jgi:Xaa-Pro aminopeptidase
MAGYRYGRLQRQIVAHDCAAALLCSPMNVRYATETRYASITNMHSPTRAVFVPFEGAAVLYDSAVPPAGSPADYIVETRATPITAFFVAGGAYADRTRAWAAEIADLVRFRAGRGRRIAVDLAEPELLIALQGAGLQIVNAEPLVERAAAVKSEDELCCIAASVAVAERGLARIRECLRPGVTERALWAHLPYENAAHGGEWFEYAMLVSGERTNPWGRECSAKQIAAGELVGVDTGMIGPFGYAADVSRTFHCKPGAPSGEQRRLYRTAVEHLACNLELLRSGMGFREFAERSWPVPDEFRSRRYNSVAHGVGMGNEWPHIPFADEWTDHDPRDGVFEENMVMAVETCIGRENGGECVKLEEMVVVSNDGCQLLSTFPFEADLLA